MTRLRPLNLDGQNLDPTATLPFVAHHRPRRSPSPPMVAHRPWGRHGLVGLWLLMTAVALIGAWFVSRREVRKAEARFNAQIKQLTVAQQQTVQKVAEVNGSINELRVRTEAALRSQATSQEGRYNDFTREVDQRIALIARREVRSALSRHERKIAQTLPPPPRKPETKRP